MKTLEDEEVDMRTTNGEIDRLFGGLEDRGDMCAKSKIEIQNNLTAIHAEDIGVCEDDGYDLGF
jgi:hypothetical protein